MKTIRKYSDIAAELEERRKKKEFEEFRRGLQKAEFTRNELLDIIIVPNFYMALAIYFLDTARGIARAAKKTEFVRTSRKYMEIRTEYTSDADNYYTFSTYDKLEAFAGEALAENHQHYLPLLYALRQEVLTKYGEQALHIEEAGLMAIFFLDMFKELHIKRFKKISKTTDMGRMVLPKFYVEMRKRASEYAHGKEIDLRKGHIDISRRSFLNNICNYEGEHLK